MPTDHEATATAIYEQLKKNGGDLRAAVDAVAGPQSGGDPQVHEQLRGLQDERTKLTGGIAPGQEPEVDPWDAAYKDFLGERAVGADREQAMTAGIQHIIDAAHRGDARVVKQDGETQAEASVRWIEQARNRQKRNAERRRSDAW